MKNIILTLTLLLPLSVYCQFTKEFTNVSEYRFSNKLLDAVESKSYNSGVRYLDSILVYTDNPDRFIILSGIECCLKTYKKKRIIQLLEIAEQNNHSLTSQKAHIEPTYPEIIKSHEHLFIPKADSIGLFLIAQQLAQMFVDDQVCRGVTFQPLVDKSERLGYEVIVNHERSAEEVDSVNTFLLDTILAKYPNLSKADVGAWGMTAVFAVIQHSGKKNLEKYKPHMDRWFENGDIQRSSYALYTDRYLMHQDKPQIYGTQLRSDNGKIVFYTIENINKIESQRMKMGLASIKKYASRFGIDWTQYYQKMSQRP